MRFTLLTCLLFSFLLQAQEAAEEYRTWTNSDGKKIEATLLGVEGTGAKIKLRTGAVFTVPLDRISAEDRDYVREHASAAQTPAAAGPKPGGQPAAEKTWPRGVALDEPPEPVIVTEDKDKKEFVYRSQHYEFHCDSRLGTNVVKEFCRIFESTWKLNCVLPLDIKPAPEEGQEFFVAKLYTNKEDYFANGGVKGSAGVYQRGEKALSVPLSSLGVKMVGSRVSLEKTSDDDNATLIHEITHQMMNHWLRRLHTWFIEGSAECVEMLEYQRGRFSLTGLKQRLSHYLKRQGSDGKNFVMIDPQELFTIEGGAWAAALTGPRGLASQNYASACLMTYFFYHLDGNGDSAGMIAFMRDVDKARTKEEGEAAFKKHLLRERSTDQLKADMKKAFRKEGINLDFAAFGKNATNSPGS